jgi:archaemetzincin
METIRIFWTREVGAGLLEYLLAMLPSLTERPAAAGSSFALPMEDFNLRRRQYQAAALLADLRPRRGAGELLLAVTGADLFAHGLNFVFGQADPAGSCAIFSLFRLGSGLTGEDPPAPLFHRRALTEAVHESGHLLALPHCADPGCAMHFSNTLAETDHKGPGLCGKCLAWLRTADLAG